MEKNPNFLLSLKGLQNPRRFRLIYLVSIILFIECFGMVNIYAQDKESITVTGIVKDAEGEPLTGVNVLIKGTTNGTITEIEGKYSIKTQSDALLEFSFIGFNQETIPVEGKTTIDVTLVEDIASLSEVVVVGYGSQTAKNITGAIETVKMDQIENLPVTSMAEALNGQIAGVSVSGGSQRPGESATLTIRQTYSFSKDGGSEIPLIVIDDMIQIDPETGLPTLDAFNRLDPSEIESITVLKDGSAAIYGSRASQGAVIVKTKRGKAGKTRFNYSGQYAFNDAISHSKTMSAYDFGIWHNRFLKADNRDSDGKNLFSAEELAEMKNMDYNWLDKAWSGAGQQKHSISMSGGNDNATYFAGATYFTQGANLGSQDYDKWNFRTGVDVKITKDLKLSGSISANNSEVEKSFTKSVANINDSSYGSKAKSSGEQADYGYLLHMPKYIPWTTTVDGEEYWFSPNPRTDRNLQSANTNRTIAGWNYFASLNSGSKQVTEDFSYNTNFALDYEVPFIKGLSFKGTYSRSQSNSNTEQVQLPYTLARIKNYNQQDHHLFTAAEDGDYKIETNRRNTRVYFNETVSKSTQVNFFANFARKFGDHDVSAMVGVERTESDFKFQRLAYENTLEDYNGTSSTAGVLSDNSYTSKTESGTLSYLGRVNYNYQSKYLLQFLFRSDASTKFAPENYWGFFPSVQVGWVLSEESWFKDAVSWIDFLKVRYSVGKTGKDNIKAWRWKQLYDIYTDKGLQFGSNGGERGGGLSPKVSPNRDAGWDATIKHNVGLDINVLQNRLNLGVEYYYDRTKDMLTSMSSSVGVPLSVGGGFAEENYAAVDNWGTEFSINWRDKVTGAFSYNVGIHFGFNDNKIKKYPEQALAHPSNNQVIEGRSTIFPAWGFETWNETSTGDGILRNEQDIQNYWNYLSARAEAAGTDPNYLGVSNIDGMKTGMLAYKDVAGDFNSEEGTQAGADGRIDKNLDYVKLANKNKRYGFTTNLGLKYKNFSFKTQISTSWGGVRFIDIVKQGTSSSHNMWAHESYWTDMFDPDDNLNGKYPSLAYYDQISAPSNFWEVNTFRCYMKNLSVGYDIPKLITSKVNIERATIGVTGNNLWDFYNPYPDKYRNMYNNSYAGYPTLRTWAVNLNVTF